MPIRCRDCQEAHLLESDSSPRILLQHHGSRIPLGQLGCTNGCLAPQLCVPAEFVPCQPHPHLCLNQGRSPVSAQTMGEPGSGCNQVHHHYSYLPAKLTHSWADIKATPWQDFQSIRPSMRAPTTSPDTPQAAAVWASSKTDGAPANHAGEMLDHRFYAPDQPRLKIICVYAGGSWDMLVSALPIVGCKKRPIPQPCRSRNWPLSRVLSAGTCEDGGRICEW